MRASSGRKTSTTTRSALALGLAGAVLMVGACSPKTDPTTTATGNEPIADTTVSGKVVISGSSTVEPITALAREAFISQNAQVAIDVDGPGTGDGFKLFCDAKIDIADASRPIKPEERADCDDSNVTFIELAIGIDGISVITPTSNKLACLNFADLYALTGPESEGKGTWADAQKLAKTLGSDTKFPNDKLVITAPGTESGTFDSFVEIVIERIGKDRIATGAVTKEQLKGTRADYAASPDDNAIIEAVFGDPGGLGWVGFAYADQADGVHKMPIAKSPGEKCVAPTAETIQDGTYPISRTLYLYVNAQKAEKNKALAAFVDFVMAGQQTFVTQADYVPLSDPAIATKRWNERVTGTDVRE